MTNPEGEGITSDEQPLNIPYWWVTGNDGGGMVPGVSDGTIPQLNFRTQDIISGILQNYVKGSPNFNASSAALWEGLGLRPGIPLPAAIIEWFLNQIGLGFIYTSMEDMASDLNEWSSNLPTIEGLVLALTGVLHGDYTDLIAWGQQLLSAFSPLNALNLFNIVPPTLLGHIDISHIGTTITNLLTDPNFLDPLGISGGDDWFHELLTGFGGTGRVFTTADGTTKELLGNLIPVSEGQVLPISGRAKWTGLVGSAPITYGADESMVVTTPTNDSSGIYTLGIRFKVLAPGRITAIRFWRPATAVASTRPVHLWSDTGTLLATANSASESGSGWKTVTLPTPYVAATNEILRASYGAAGGAWSYRAGLPTSASAHLQVLGSNYKDLASAFPTEASTSTYFADIVYQGEEAPAVNEPVAIGVTGYGAGGGAIVQEVIDSHNTIPTTTDWITLSGTFTVPALVESLRTRLIVTGGATAGEVSFSTLSATKIGAMLQRLIAGTDPGNLLPDDIENLFVGIVTNTLSLLEKAAQGDLEDLISTIAGDFGDTIADAEERLNDFLHSLSPLNGSHINTGSIGDQFVPGLNTIHDAVVTAVGKLTGSGFDITKVIESLTGQTNSVVSNATLSSILHGRLATAESKLAALPVSLGGTGVGISYGGIVGCNDTDDFERTSTTSLGPTWTQYYSSGGGVWAIPNGHDAEYMWSGTSNREFVAIRNNTSLLRSLTDYQRVTMVLSSKATRHYDSVLGTYNYVGHNDVWLRVSDATTSLANITGIRIRFGGDGSISIARFVSGAGVTLKSYPTGTYTPPGPGGTLIGEAGDMNGGTPGQRYFRGIYGNNILIEITEVGVASGFGAAYRRWGHGGRVEGWSGLFDNGQERPGTLHHWNGMDQVFP